VTSGNGVADLLTETFRNEWARLVAFTMRLLGDLQAAEDVVQDVLVSAMYRWPLAGIPNEPAAWLMTACRNRALNVLRDAGRARDRTRALALTLTSADVDDTPMWTIGDDRLRLVFMCCHPVLSVDAQIALTLRMLGGLSTDEIARAWHVPSATIAQRIVRAKRTLAEKKVPFVEPAGAQVAERLPAVLDVVYLIFNEGYLASSGGDLMRPPLAVEAHRLSRLLTDLLPDRPEPWALRALIAFQRSRDETRLDDAGRLLTLEQQDRARWDRVLIAEGRDALTRADILTANPPGSAVLLQARIAACHAMAPSYETTDWGAILECYDHLLVSNDSPVVALNRAVAVAMVDGPDAALPLLDALVDDPALADAHRVWAVRADILRRLGERGRAVQDYDAALARVDNDIERHHLADMRARCVVEPN
jgi:RNA polymerase sigma factor (sigma-70 family)